ISNPYAFLTTLIPNASTTFCVGDSVVLRAKDAITPGANATQYQWFFNGNLISSAADSLYTAKLEGEYKIRISNECASSTFSQPINIKTLQYAAPFFDTTTVTNNPLCP